ncbi:MAG: FG-GAP-like repeat-containing protein [Nitrosomonadaceae bacterium]
MEVTNIQAVGEIMQFAVSADLGAGLGITVNHEGNFPNLFTALESTDPGDTVFVSEGRYEASNLLLKEGRNLKGENPVTTVLDGGGDKILRLSQVENTTISGFTFTNTQTAISVIGSGGLINYNIFRDIDGSAIICSRSSPEIRNNTFVNGSSAGIGCFSGSAPVIENNIIVYNGIGISSSTNSFPVVLYNDVWNNGHDYLGLSPGTLDIMLDPLFVNLFFEDFHLRPGSPCIDSGNPAPAFNDPDGTRNDIGALFFDLEHVTSIEGIRVNAGDQAFISENSTFFASDQPYTDGGWGYIAGEARRTFDPIANTNDDSLYQWDRRALQAYLFDIPNGRYRVTLHFCEIVWQETGRRVFDVEIEDRTVLEAFDIFARVGHDFATSLFFFTDVLDGQLNIQFSPQIGLTQVSALEVVPAQPLLIDIANFAKVAHTALSQGVAIGDYNNDGFQDIFIANAGRANVLFRNNGLGLFTNTTLEAQFLLSGGGKMGVWGDYDNDGDLDIYVARDRIPNILYQNNGNGTFTEVAEIAGVDDRGKGISCAWGDYDNDGNLDIFVANDGPDVLYRNQGDGTFIDVTDSAGIKSLDASTDAILGDINNDGYLDLLVTHDDNSTAMANHLYINNQSGGFSETEFASNGLGAAFGDYDNDGNLDVFMITRALPDGSTQPRLFHNEGGENFVDVAASAGITFEDESAALGAGWVDIENDGYLDLFILLEDQPDLLYHNKGDGTFINMADSAGLENRDLERVSAFGDLDEDGDQDIYVARFGKENLLYQNQGNANNWLMVKTVGTRSNNAGIGAKIRVVTGNLVQIREVQGGSGFRSQNSLPVVIGLGAAPVIDTLEVRWPSGNVDKQTNFTDINQIIEVVESDVVSVDLIAFSARVEDGRILIEWETANAIHFDRFDLERSRDGLHFNKVVTIVFKGETGYTWVDENLPIGVYDYRLKLIDVDGTFRVSDTIEVNLTPPIEFGLSQNFPNPFNAGTTIRYSLPKNEHVIIKIYDLRGREVLTLLDAPKQVGYHTIKWDGTDNAGTSSASGIYFYILQAGDFVQTRKLILLK